MTMTKEINEVAYSWKGNLVNPILAIISGTSMLDMNEGKQNKSIILFLDEVLDNLDGSINWKKTIDMVITEKDVLKYLIKNEFEGANIKIFITVKNAPKIECFMTRFYNASEKKLESINKDMKNVIFEHIIKEHKRSQETYIVGMGRGAIPAMDLTAKAGPKIKCALFIQPKADLTDEIDLFRDLAKLIYTKIVFVTDSDSHDHATALSQYKTDMIASMIDKSYKNMVVCIDWDNINEYSASKEDWKEVHQRFGDRQQILMNNKLSDALKSNGVPYNEFINGLPDFRSYALSDNPRETDKMRHNVNKIFANIELKNYMLQFLEEYDGKNTQGIIQDNGGNKNFFFIQHDDFNRGIWASKGNLPRNAVINNGQRVYFMVCSDDFGRPIAKDIKFDLNRNPEILQTRMTTTKDKGARGLGRNVISMEQLEEEINRMKIEIKEIKEWIKSESRSKSRNDSFSFVKSPSLKRQKNRTNLFSRD